MLIINIDQIRKQTGPPMISGLSRLARRLRRPHPNHACLWRTHPHLNKFCRFLQFCLQNGWQNLEFLWTGLNLHDFAGYFTLFQSWGFDMTSEFFVILSSKKWIYTCHSVTFTYCMGKYMKIWWWSRWNGVPYLRFLSKTKHMVSSKIPQQKNSALIPHCFLRPLAYYLRFATVFWPRMNLILRSHLHCFSHTNCFLHSIAGHMQEDTSGTRCNVTSCRVKTCNLTILTSWRGRLRWVTHVSSL